MASFKRQSSMVGAEVLDVRQATRLAGVPVCEETHVVDLTKFLHNNEPSMREKITTKRQKLTSKDM